MHEPMGSLVTETHDPGHGQLEDLGLLSGQSRARVLEAYRSLPPGASMEVAAEERVDRLVADLRARYGSHFYWWPLERGPSVWRAVLAKPCAEASQTVGAAMSADHLRLCELWGRFALAVDSCQRDGIHRIAGELTVGLRRYMDIEESLLFPLLDAQTHNNAADLTEIMRSEHHQIRGIVRDLDQLHATANCEAILAMFHRPIEPMTLLERHCRREEAALYPLMDTVFSFAEQQELLSLIQVFEI